MKVNNNYSVGFYEYSEPDEEGNISFKVVRSSLTLEEAENLIEDKSHHKIKECFKEKNDLILARQFVSRIYSQDLSRPIQNQIRQTARVVYDYLKRLDEVK